jgi:hypothetical protein
MAEVYDLLGRLQSLESSTWMCLLEENMSIGKLLVKDEHGTLQLAPKYASSQTFNIEDVMHAMQLYRNEVSLFCGSILPFSAPP